MERRLADAESLQLPIGIAESDIYTTLAYGNRVHGDFDEVGIDDLKRLGVWRSDNVHVDQIRIYQIVGVGISRGLGEVYDLDIAVRE
ncbi:MAG: hypothetical protein AAGD22_16170 [Verrucomicrobiota bacterium]